MPDRAASAVRVLRKWGSGFEEAASRDSAEGLDDEVRIIRTVGNGALFFFFFVFFFYKKKFVRVVCKRKQ